MRNSLISHEKKTQNKKIKTAFTRCPSQKVNSFTVNNSSQTEFDGEWFEHLKKGKKKATKYFQYTHLYIPQNTNYINNYLLTNRHVVLSDSFFFHADLKISSYRDHLNSIVSRLASLALTATWVKTNKEKDKKQLSSPSISPHKLMVVRQSACWGKLEALSDV